MKCGGSLLSEKQSMSVPVVGIGPVNVCMGYRLMHMVMVVWLPVVFLVMPMFVMFILTMGVLMPMSDSFMDMGMLVPLPVKA